jgi:uncharacterized protein
MDNPENQSMSSSESEPAQEAVSEDMLNESLPSCIQFFLKGDRVLAVKIEPNSEFPGGIPVGTLREWISTQGYDSWRLHEDTLMRVAVESRRLDKTKEYIIAQQEDCRIEVQLSSDRLNAWIKISPAAGGLAFSETLLRQALAEHNVCFGIDEETVTNVLHEGECERTLVAEGILPTPGEPARFEKLVKDSEHKGVPQERKDGRVDYKDLGLITSVPKGTPLLRKIPPGQGTPGTGVDGKPIPAPAGLDRFFHPGVGTAPSQDDPCLVVATRPGQPSYQDNSVQIDSTLEFEAVNPSTGNIDFVGNVLIRGPVESGFIVKAGEDLTILDTVEGSKLIAGKNISLLTGIYGRTKSEIIAGGNIEAKFISDCTVRCGGNIEVMDQISHSFVECEGAVYVGKSGGRGQIFGGRVSAMREVFAQIIGSNSETATYVEIAAPKKLLLRQAELNEAVEKSGLEQKRIEKELQALGEEGKDSPEAQTLLKKYASTSGKLGEIKKEQEELKKRLSVLEKAKIRAYEVHRGVTLMVGKTKQCFAESTTDVSLQDQPVKNQKKETPSPKQ